MFYSHFVEFRIESEVIHICLLVGFRMSLVVEGPKELKRDIELNLYIYST